MHDWLDRINAPDEPTRFAAVVEGVDRALADGALAPEELAALERAIGELRAQGGLDLAALERVRAELRAQVERRGGLRNALHGLSLHLFDKVQKEGDAAAAALERRYRGGGLLYAFLRAALNLALASGAPGREMGQTAEVWRAELARGHDLGSRAIERLTQSPADVASLADLSRAMTGIAAVLAVLGRELSNDARVLGELVRLVQDYRTHHAAGPVEQQAVDRVLDALGRLDHEVRWEMSLREEGERALRTFARRQLTDDPAFAALGYADLERRREEVESRRGVLDELTRGTDALAGAANRVTTALRRRVEIDREVVARETEVRQVEVEAAALRERCANLERELDALRAEAKRGHGGVTSPSVQNAESRITDTHREIEAKVGRVASLWGAVKRLREERVTVERDLVDARLDVPVRAGALEPAVRVFNEAYGPLRPELAVATLAREGAMPVSVALRGVREVDLNGWARGQSLVAAVVAEVRDRAEAIGREESALRAREEALVEQRCREVTQSLRNGGP